mgnify:CR=1 FL=1
MYFVKSTNTIYFAKFARKRLADKYLAKIFFAK